MVAEMRLPTMLDTSPMPAVDYPATGTPLPSPPPKLEPEGRKSKVPVALPSAANSQRGAEAGRSGVQTTITRYTMLGDSRLG